MNTCKNCAYCVYDEATGSYRCDIYDRRIRDASKHTDCEDHEKKDGGKR
jgi:hypothetical protein